MPSRMRCGARSSAARTASRRTSSSCRATSSRLQPGQRVQAVPGAGLKVPIWILGSSLFGAQLAAALGLPYAFASHFAPGAMMQAIDVYRRGFQPSEQLDRPYVMLGFNVIAAETDEEARFLSTSRQQAFLNLRRGRPTRLPPPSDDVAMSWQEEAMIARSPVVLGGRLARDRAARARGVHRAHQARRADHRRADLRPRRPAALV